MGKWPLLTSELDRPGTPAEEADLEVGDLVIVDFHSDLDKPPGQRSQLRGEVSEVRGDDRNVVALLRSGWAINPGDRVVWRRPANEWGPGP